MASVGSGALTAGLPSGGSIIQIRSQGSVGGPLSAGGFALAGGVTTSRRARTEVYTARGGCKRDASPRRAPRPARREKAARAGQIGAISARIPTAREVSGTVPQVPSRAAV